MRNKYAVNSKISEAKTRKMVQGFAHGDDAPSIAVCAGVNRNTVNRFLRGIRERIASGCDERAVEQGDILTYERLKAWMDNLAGSLQFGIKACAQCVQVGVGYRDETADASDYDMWVCLGGNHILQWCASTSAHESLSDFRAYVTNRMEWTQVLPEYVLYFHLKECAFRYNHDEQEIYHKTLKMLRDYPL